MIRMENVTKLFGAHSAVTDLNLVVAPACITLLLGPNGAGKTTTMRLMTGFYRPDAGRVWIDGTPDIADRPALRARIGYLPENNPLYDDMTVLEYLHMVARLRGLAGRAARTAAAEAAERCLLSEVPHRRAGELSKGVRQRLGLAAALLGRPDILVLDEPATGLDPLQTARMAELIADLGKEHTLLLSSHLLDQSLRLAAHVVVMDQGRIKFQGSPDAFYAACPPTGVRLVVAAAPDELRRRLNGLAVGARLQHLGQDGPFFRYRLDCPLPDEAALQLAEAIQGLRVRELAPEAAGADACFAGLLGGVST